MEQQSAAGPQDLKKDRSNAQEAGSNSSVPATSEAPAQANGVAVNGAQPNGVPVQKIDIPSTNGEHADVNMALAGSNEAPPLDGDWRQTDFNKSLGKLMDRTAQQCYLDLNATLTSMSEEGAPESVSAPLTNGALAAQGQLDTSETSLKKKRMLLDFAQEQRDRFTKTLVLSDWSRNAEDMAKFIDIQLWQKKQRESYSWAAGAIGETKRRMLDFRVPAPNIEGAMELLSTGKASGVPDLGYIPPKRLSAKQLLKTLKDMNVTLATRLNLHEDLPHYMQEFSIANGRATFTVASEFEVDLSVGDEETTSPFYFIDMRFLFSPNPGILNDTLRPFLELHANAALSKNGLQGCYDFLHNFVLTHKINTLRSQAQDLIRDGKWFDCIKVENLRRALVVQYWAGMPGPKSWFEIGIISGKQKASSRRKATPMLSVRWFRKGQEVRDEVLDFDWKTLDLQACLLKAIAKHCFGKLAMTKDGLKSLTPPENPMLATEMPNQEVAVEECKLKLSLPALRKPLTVKMEPVTGQFSITPPSNATLFNERVLNNDPNVDVTRVLATIVCSVVQEQLHKLAELLGWQEIRNLASTKSKFGADVWRRSVFLMPGWGDQWALAVTFGLGGEKWWIAQLRETKPNPQTPAVLKEITNVRRIPLGEAFGKQPEISRASLLRMERLALAEVSFTVLSQELRSLRIPHRFEKPALTDDDTSVRSRSSGSVFIQFSPLMRNPHDKAWKPWAAESVRLSHHGFEAEGSEAVVGQQGFVRHDLRLSLEPGMMKHLQQHLTHAGDRDIAISATGGLALRLRTPFGEPFVEQIRTRLRGVERMDSYVATLRRLHYKCTFASLTRLAFSYSKAPELSAQISFANDGNLPVRLKLEPAESNPHLRIRVMLEQGLNTGREDAFLLFSQILTLTLPLLQGFEPLESAHLARQTVSVRARAATWYSVVYKAPLLPCSFTVRARTKRQGGKTEVKWHVEETKGRADGAAVHEGLSQALKALWQKKGEGWFGIGNGLIAEPRGIAQAFEQLDEVVRQAEHAPAAAEPVALSNTPTMDTTKQQQPPPPPKQQPTELKQAPKQQPRSAQPAQKPKQPAQKSEPTDVIMLD